MKKVFSIILVLTIMLISIMSVAQTVTQPTANQECDKITYFSESRKPDFNTFLAGVRGAIIVQKTNSFNLYYARALTALREYLEEMGFETIKYMFLDDESTYIENPEYVRVAIGYNLNILNNPFYYYNIELYFWHATCDNCEWDFSTYKTAKNQYGFGIALRSMYNSKKPAFNRNYVMQLAKWKTCWTETKYKNHVISNDCDAIEGIYEKASGSPKYRVALRKMNGSYHLIYLSGADDENKYHWDEGEIKAFLEPTATPLLYKAKWIMALKSENSDCYISFEKGLMNVVLKNEKDVYIKLFPSVDDKFGNSSSTAEGSGTGWAISSNGYIVTNYHVIENAKSIKVRGVNGNFSNTFNAKIITEDKNNDLAVIKIEDANFTSLGTIPYTISTKTIDADNSVFVLGYPLRSTMGDEIKLTNGIVSSKSGFQGDVTSYQVSAPIQPGNSGAPLFDNKGNVVGIINAKHVGAENASYAVKSSYLLNLLDIVQSPPKLQTVNTLIGKPLTEQVKILKKYVYIIEVK